MKNAIILFSGGLDSTTCLFYARKQGFNCYALSFNYGQKHCSELNAAKTICAHYDIPQKIFTIPIHEFSNSALTDVNLQVPSYIENDTSIPNTYVPARNTIFLSVALGFAEVLKASHIFIGVSAIDYSNYPDCRPEFINAFQTLANLATKEGAEHHSFHIETPLIHLSKAETIKLGQELGIDYSMTVSCYKANIDGRACGSCASCELRKKGFKEAHLYDPTLYINN